MLFKDRYDAGRILAGQLEKYKDRRDVIVLALPRGGVPVACEVSRALNAPLDIFLVRKLGVPGQEELGMGAIATGGVRVLNDELIRQLRIPPNVIDAITESEQQEIERRAHLYRGEKPAADVRGRTVIVVDDGLATGSTMLAALSALRQLQPERLVVAVPVAPPETCESVRAYADEVVCSQTPDPFRSVGSWYRGFDQTTDEEVRDLLKRAA
jgi:putative phosphoribosyl transferase